MKKILYFLIGFSISLAVGNYAYSDIQCLKVTGAGYEGELDIYEGFYGTQQEAIDAGNAACWDWVGTCAAVNGYFTAVEGAVTFEDGGPVTTYVARVFENPGGGVPTINHYYGYINTGQELCPTDNDNDGNPNSSDFYPDDPEPYLVQKLLYFTDDGTPTGNEVGAAWQTDRGDLFTTGDVPEEGDPDFYKGNYILDPFYIDPIPEIDSYGISGNERALITPQQPSMTTGAPSGVAGDHSGDTGMDGGTISTGTETDNEALRGTKTNTGITATNTKRMGDYLRDMKLSLANIDRNIARGGSGGGLIGVPTGNESPTAAEIGEAIDDKLVDDSQHHDSSNTESLEEYSFGTKFDDEKTKYMDRFTTFKDELATSPLFSLKDELIGSIPSGGSSSMSLSIGNWGNASSQSVSFDFADYSSAWDVLKYLLPILAGFTCLRILVLKHS